MNKWTRRLKKSITESETTTAKQTPTLKSCHNAPFFLKFLVKLYSKINRNLYFIYNNPTIILVYC